MQFYLVTCSRASKADMCAHTIINVISIQMQYNNIFVEFKKRYKNNKS
jgi:hypothetical protein